MKNSVYGIVYTVCKTGNICMFMFDINTILLEVYM